MHPHTYEYVPYWTNRFILHTKATMIPHRRETKDSPKNLTLNTLGWEKKGTDIASDQVDEPNQLVNLLHVNYVLTLQFTQVLLEAQVVKLS